MIDLAGYGIRLARPRIGWQGASCPACARTKHRPNDDALGVRLFPDGGAYWSCRRCGWRGSIRSGNALPHPARQVRLCGAESQRASSGLSGEAMALWRSCQQLVAGCPVIRYLQHRACPVPPNDVRWHPALRHPFGYVGPCLVALVTDVVTGEPINLHRTWLAADGSGKAPLDRPRLLLKGHRKAGGVVRLWPDDEVTLGLCVAEGVETALSAAFGFGRAWACLDAGNLAGLPALDGIEALTIVADHDAAGLKAAAACAERWLVAGREVRIWRAPDLGDDLNDYASRAA